MAARLAPEVSVVIPALNELHSIARALESTRLPGVERIVVDGGSSDGTVELARSLGAEKVIHSASGRAHQLDLGYRESRAGVIVFLHADTRLGPGWLEAIRASLGDAAVAGGAFRLGFDSHRWIYRLAELLVRVRSRLALLPFGDQAPLHPTRADRRAGWNPSGPDLRGPGPGAADPKARAPRPAAGVCLDLGSTLRAKRGAAPDTAQPGCAVSVGPGSGPGAGGGLVLAQAGALSGPELSGLVGFCGSLPGSRPEPA